MTLTEVPVPTYLYRCYLPGSERQMCSGRYLTESANTYALSRPECLEDFARHLDIENEDPTALVSTTSSLLRAVHIAFEYSSQYEAYEIYLAVVSPRSATVHHAISLAIDLDEQGLLWNGNPSVYESEWLFEWIIPSDDIIHTVSLQTLIGRGFTLFNLTGKQCVPNNLSEFRRAVQAHWKKRSQGDRAYECAVTATCFGYHAPFEGLAEEIYKWTFSKNSQGDYQQTIKEAVELVSEEYESVLVDRISEHTADMKDLYDAFACADESYIEAVGHIEATISERLDREDALKEARAVYDEYQEWLMSRLAEIDIEIGY